MAAICAQTSWAETTDREDKYSRVETRQTDSTFYMNAIDAVGVTTDLEKIECYNPATGW